VTISARYKYALERLRLLTRISMSETVTVSLRLLFERLRTIDLRAIDNERDRDAMAPRRD
jgi:hypothetical protein